MFDFFLWLVQHVSVYVGQNVGMTFGDWGIEFIGDPGMFTCGEQC